MIEFEQFELIRKKHGSYCSWALWAKPLDAPKSNIHDLSVFDPEKNPMVLSALRPNVALVGLNISRPFTECFRNFHDANPYANDFKIRFALSGTDYYGAYMTDIIKNEVEVKASAMVAKLKQQPELLQKNVDCFCEELSDLKSSDLLIMAFGRHAYELIRDYVPQSKFKSLIKLTHYSHQISKENYRERVLSQLKYAGGTTRVFERET